MDALLTNGFLDKGLLLEVKRPSSTLDLLSLLMDELAYGVLVTTLEAQVLHANEAARTVLARSGILETTGDMLRSSTVDNSKAMHDALAKVAEGKRSLISLSAEGFALTLAVVPLRGELGMPARAALFFARPAVYESLMLGFFARSHGLTATEEHVLGILCQGYSTPEIAGQMKVAVSTIRSHVRSLCAKTRSSGVRELVNRVAVLPPVAPVPRQDRVH